MAAAAIEMNGQGLAEEVSLGFDDETVENECAEGENPDPMRDLVH